MPAENPPAENRFAANPSSGSPAAFASPSGDSGSAPPASAPPAQPAASASLRPVGASSQVSLVTYVYNDGELADALLHSLQTWSRKPNEIIVVDDGSCPPYTPPALPGLPKPRLCRLAANQGVGVSKARGLGLARGEFILSMDCDMRLAPDWQEQSLPAAARPEIGLVGVSVLCAGGDDLTARYLRLAEQQLLPDGETDFLSGSVWLMRRQVWEAVGGFGGYAARTHEDHHFCARVRRAGYKLVSCAARPGLQVRSLSRHDMILRFAAWLHGGILDSVRAQPNPDGVRAAGYAAGLGALRRLETALQENLEREFIYFELLALANLCLRIFQTAARAEGEPGGPTEAPDWLVRERRAWLGALAGLLAPFRLLGKVLQADLAVLGWRFSGPDAAAFSGDKTGVSAVAGASPAACGACGASGACSGPAPESGGQVAPTVYWSELMNIFKSLAAPNGVFAYLNGPGLRRIIQEDAQAGRNFSFYRTLYRPGA